MIQLSPKSNSMPSAGVTEKFPSIIRRKSGKAMFIWLIVLCLLGICLLYFSVFKALTSRFADIEFSKPTREDKMLRLTQDKTNKPINEETINQNVKPAIFLNRKSSGHTENQHYSQVFDEGHSMNNISKKSPGLLKITEANNSSTALTREESSNTTTTVTFNSSLVVHCKESPYIDCFPPNLKPRSGKIFKIAYLRRPVWIPLTGLDVTGCMISQCVVDDNKVTNDTDIVVIYGVGLRDNYPMPQRWPHQLYAIHTLEAPLNTRADFITKGQSPWNQRVNIFMSYRLDADVTLAYDRLRFDPKPLDQRPNYYKIAKKKTRTAVWIVSHCRTPSRREEYVQEMQKYIDVKIFGRCGTRCPKSNIHCNNWPTKYKFYLSFENSLCTDYVTEKFFKIFGHNMHVIPVVRGGADYDTHFPSFTYINSAHFKTPKDLALHLKDLAADLDTYSKYLEYKDLYTNVPYVNKVCRMCEYLHTQPLPEPSQTYNLTSHMVDNQCRSPTDI